MYVYIYMYGYVAQALEFADGEMWPAERPADSQHFPRHRRRCGSFASSRGLLALGFVHVERRAQGEWRVGFD